MRETIERRRRELAAELEAGQRLLAELSAREDDLRRNLLRIGGAVRVLDELLAGEAELASESSPVRRAAG